MSYILDSWVTSSEAKIDRLATEYTWDPFWNLKIKERPYDSIKLGSARGLFFGTGSYGGLLSTATDYLRFCHMLLNHGELNGIRLLSQKSVDLMASDHTHGLYVYVHGYGWAYVLGVGVRTDLTKSNCIGSVGAYGWGGAACTYFFIDPVEELISLACAQVHCYSRKPGFHFNQEFERAIYQALQNRA